ncbi:metalloprotease family protein [Staphylococcus canis]|uniref:DUF3267 domain-containing protein n=1 Tax=Staphylococcus canis TaxID=2724942 RepID=A0ABS0T7T0_9STAP|nr:metalloprotease family protein [Staphylococcus canis]MBI5974742.1 DUF3267 domain-containing protein [Staphylococcus canis]
MYQINLYNNKQKMKRFLVFQFIVILIFIVLSYKWSMSLTLLHEQNIGMNIFLGVSGFIILEIVHELVKVLILRMITNRHQAFHRYQNGVLITYLPHYYFNRITFFLYTLLPGIILMLLLLIWFTLMPYSSIIFIFALHMAYLSIPIYFVAVGLSKTHVQFVEMTESGINLYQEKPTI